MASRTGTETTSKPDPGTLLIVIHDFQARSSDELTLAKGDRVELVERDDEYGDGWYLGRHAGTGETGLFPEVYTRPAPKTAPAVVVPAAIALPRSAPPEQITNPIPSPDAVPNEARMSVPTPETGRQQHQATRHASASELRAPSVTSPPLPSASIFKDQPASAGLPPTASGIAAVAALSPNKHQHGQDSPVLNETLTVIQEHISDMNNAPRFTHSDRRGNDSGSEYSSHLDHRMSYINGEETDEEEEMLLTQEQVSSWTPDQVSTYLESVGVEPKHCEVFREQEISGEVILGMDQTSVFLKEFELGSVGRRLKTWQKIKTLQDDIQSRTPSATRRTTQTYGSEIGSEDSKSRTGGPTRQPSVADKHSFVNGRSSVQKGRSDTITGPSPMVSPKTGVENIPAVKIQHEHRPSAASIRDLHHSRRHSSTDFGSSSLSTKLTTSESTSSIEPPPQEHKKQPSFDRNWTMGAAATPPVGRPVSSAGFPVQQIDSKESVLSSPPVGSQIDLDRGYFSGGEDGRKRNVLRKRDPASHSRNSSYADEQRVRSATAHARHSRFGSVDSVRDRPTTPSASQKYYGLSARQSRRFGSTDSTTRHTSVVSHSGSPSIPRPERPDADLIKDQSPKSPERPERTPEWKLPTAFSDRFNLRAVSENTTPTTTTDKSITSSMENKESPMDSPARTGSSRESGKGSMDSETPEQSKSSVHLPSVGIRGRKKSKKETSAYTRGLEKKTPQEQMQDCDFSGWMKKKSTNLMTTWKPRLFVLKGRRLSYYYDENDTEEKGLIDISFHRVLPADNDRLTGLHATLTGATSNPTSPSDYTLITRSPDGVTEPESTLSKGSGDSTFIFKLVPPRAGLSRAVTFTKPTVHYFAVPSIAVGRLWMAALMKATIDRDDSQPVSTTYQQKTISLAKARAMRHRPPALMNLDEKVEEEIKTPAVDLNGLNIQGIIFDDRVENEGDSGVSGLSKLEAHSTPEPTAV